MKLVVGLVKFGSVSFHNWFFSVHRTRADFSSDPSHKYYTKYDGIVILGFLAGVYR